MDKVQRYVLITHESERIDGRGDDVKILKEILEEGQCTLISSKKDQVSILSSCLGFSGNVVSDPASVALGLVEYKENEPKQLSENDFDEDMNEIQIIDNPALFQQISNNLQTILLTNNQQNVRFAQKVKLDHVYSELSKESEISDLISKNRETLLKRQLIILDLKQDTQLSLLDSVFQELSKIGINQDESLNIRYICSPKHWQNNFFELNQEIDPELQDLIPRQTWKFRKGEFQKDLEDAQHQLSLSVFYQKNHNRKDLLTKYSQIDTKEGLRSISNGIINSNALFREIIFKLGKLPKYGA